MRSGRDAFFGGNRYNSNMFSLENGQIMRNRLNFKAHKVFMFMVGKNHSNTQIIYENTIFGMGIKSGKNSILLKTTQKSVA